MDCQCDTCKGACVNKPGWFKPGEAEKAANFLGMPFQEFFQKFLSVDFYYRKEEPIWVLSPAVKTGTAGKEFGMNPRGECVFFKEGKCQIHEVKPYECAAYDHTKSNEESQEERMSEVVLPWQEEVPSAQIRELLGREPQTPDNDFLGMLELLLPDTIRHDLAGDDPKLRSGLDKFFDIAKRFFEADGKEAKQKLVSELEQNRKTVMEALIKKVEGSCKSI